MLSGLESGGRNREWAAWLPGEKYPGGVCVCVGRGLFQPVEQSTLP